MKYSYKLNSRRNLALKKRDVYGISSIDFIVIKGLSKCLLYTAALQKHLQKKDLLTDKKHNQIKKVMERIVDGIDEQLRIDPSAIIPENRLKRPQGRYYTFDDFRRHNFSGLFRFRSPTDLQRLHEGFGLPEKVRIHTYQTTGKEILMISLVRLAYPHRWEDVEEIFPRLKRWKLQRCFYWFLDYMIQNWSYLILNNRDYWVPQMGNMATAIKNKLASLPNEDYRLHFPDNLPFTVFSFIDNTMTAMCRPGGGPIVEWETVEWEYKDVKGQWKYLDYRHALKITNQPLAKIVITCFILRNALNTMYGSQTSLYFDILPPTFEEWVHQGPQAHPIPTDSLFHPDYHSSISALLQFGLSQ